MANTTRESNPLDNLLKLAEQMSNEEIAEEIERLSNKLTNCDLKDYLNEWFNNIVKQ